MGNIPSNTKIALNMHIDIEVFTVAGCNKCGRAEELMREISAELNVGRIQWRTVDVVEHIDHAVELGVRATPSIAINGVLSFTGMPTRSALLHKIRQLLDT